MNLKKLFDCIYFECAAPLLKNSSDLAMVKDYRSAYVNRNTSRKKTSKCKRWVLIFQVC